MTDFSVDVIGTSSRTGSLTETFVDWDSDISLGFYDSASFDQLTDPLGLAIGTDVYFQLNWAHRAEDFPVQFFVERCTVSDPITGNAFNIIQGKVV